MGCSRVGGLRSVETSFRLCVSERAVACSRAESRANSGAVPLTQAAYFGVYEVCKANLTAGLQTFARTEREMTAAAWSAMLVAGGFAGVATWGSSYPLGACAARVVQALRVL